jgi:ubiquitin C-terminal hydrolase
MPHYLIIHLKRFEEVEQQFIKNKKPIEYPLAMDMDE